MEMATFRALEHQHTEFISTASGGKREDEKKEDKRKIRFLAQSLRSSLSAY